MSASATIPADSTLAPLVTALAAVPDEIAIVRNWDDRKLIDEAERCADLISQAGIMLWWDEKIREKQRREAARSLPGTDDIEIDPDDVTAAVARGLAILAIRPLGVEFGGLHLCDHPAGFGCEPGKLTIDPAPKGDHIFKAHGACWTPRPLAEEVTRHALEPIVYNPGPLHTTDESAWKLLPVAKILTEQVADIAVGAGVFPIAALRYLAARILDHALDHIATDVEQDVRAAVITHCLYGADIDPASIELCRIVVALMVPLIDIDTEVHRRFRCGDSLLGIEHIDQLRYWDLDAQRGRAVHAAPVINVNVVAAAGGLDVLWLLADLLVGAALATAGKKTARKRMAAEIEMLAVRVAAGDPAAIAMARARARELLDADLPPWLSPRKPLHWPLAFPEVFGATVASAAISEEATMPVEARPNLIVGDTLKAKPKEAAAVMLPGMEEAA